MPTLAEVKKQIKELPDRYVFWTQKEIRALPKILDNGELIRGITSGIMKNATWLVVCTNRRILFINRGMFYGLRQVQVPLDRIQSIDHSFTLVFGSISIWDGASAFSVGMILKGSIMPFVRATEASMNDLRRRAAAPQPSAPQVATAAAPPTDVASQLMKLAQLKEKGYLTEEEFHTQKKKLLG